MLGIIPIIQLGISLIGTILQNKGIIGASTDTLINNLSGSATTLLSGLAANKGSSTVAIQDTMLALATLSGVIATLKATKGLTNDALALVNEADVSVSAALAGYVQAGTGFNVGLFAPVATV